MIDKITPRALDKSSDDKLIAKTSMRDALNLHITDNNEVGGSGAETRGAPTGGNAGILKNIKGHELVDYGFPSDVPSTTEYVNKVIGSVTDEKTQICYFFVWSEGPEDHGIWAYDKYGKLPESKIAGAGAPNSLRKIFTSAQFNFPEHGFVKGDIIYTNTNEFEKHPAISQHLETNQNLKIGFEKDVLLYFTDHKNEPRKINVYRALLEKGDALATYDVYGTADFICACPKAPLSRITFEFSPDPNLSTNNFAASPGFQFAYQNIYKDGVESAISTYSVMAFPPSVIHRGAAQSSDILAHNLCTLTIPPVGPEIKKIRILARYGNTANFFEIDEVSNTTSTTENWDLSSRTYKFYNDRVASGVSPKEVDKTFDNLPRKAQAQTAISNRLIYGNYLEGYDNVDTICESNVVYNERPQDFLDLTLRAHPSIEPSNYGDNKCVGFQIDTSEIPSSISAGTVVNVSLDYTPDRNFHIYQADETGSNYGSYHQSRQMGGYSSNAAGYRHWPLTSYHNFFYSEGEEGVSMGGANQTHENSPADLQEKGVGGITGQQDSWKNQNASGGKFLSQKGEMFFGQNFGVGSVNDFGGASTPKWRVENQGQGDVGYILDNGNKSRYGTSAGNPLILKSTPLQFKVKFKLVLDIEFEGKKLVEETITEALAGADGVTVANGGGGIFSWANWIEIDTDSDDVQNTVRIEKSDYDLQLGYEDNDPFTPNFDFKKIMPGDDLSYLICGVGSTPHESRLQTEEAEQEQDVSSDYFGLSSEETQPFGYFIINKAEVDFHLELVDESLHSRPRKHLRLAISKIDIDDDDIMTCFKRLDPTSPWWAIHPSTIQDVNFNKYFATYNQPSTFTANPNTIFYTGGNIGSAEDVLWTESPAYKFRLPDPILHEEIDTDTVHPRSWFTAAFWASTESGFDDDALPNSEAGGVKHVNVGFCGWMDFNSGNTPLFNGPPASMLDSEGKYIPRINQNFFRYSLMDGEGGPGGSNAGGNSAYDKYGNSKYGSIAARIDFGYDGEAVEVKTTHLGQTYHLYQALVGGSRAYYDNAVYADGTAAAGGTLGTTPLGTGNISVASASNEGLGLAEDPNFPGLWRETYVVSGPFFTGSIAMNPVVGETSDAANPQPFPPVRDFTTTLPLVWVNSQGLSLNNNEPIPQNWLRTSYPWPQVFRPTGPFSWINSQGLITNAQLDLTPFSNPQWYSEIGNESTLTSMAPSLWGAPIGSPPPHDYFGSVDFSLTHSAIEGNTQTSFVFGEEEGHMSFKSSATHEFGIVYYDQRGRHGYVNHLDTVYVEGYSPQSRLGNDKQGSAHIELNLKHSPPSWAHNYKIVYSKNTSVSDFVQYSAGGAFTAEGESPSGDPSRIYVSLNYLQGHPISYSSAWGARSKEGSMAIYTPEEGDRLRVISYMLPPGGTPVPERVYPQNYDFEVSSVVSLDNSEENPLFYYDNGLLQKPENRQGLFLVIKNNDAAIGFRYQDVRDDAHNWKNNCLIEIYSPTKELDAEDRLYYEIGDTYKVVKAEDGSLVHEQNEILLTEGDVYFRSAAVNFRDYDESILEGGLLGYEDIIIDTPEDIETVDYDSFRASESNFKSYYIESPVGTDLFKSDSLSVGRPNIIKHDAQEAYKEASVIHSDRDVTNAGKVSYSSFNRSIPIDQDLDLKSGPINYLVNHDENCLFIQQSKTGHIPIDRSIISDVSGESSLIASSKFLNPPRYYAGRAGAGGNPESVVSIDNAVYFANKSLGEVYKVSGENGVNVISEKNMKTYFQELFKSAINQSTINGDDVRVVGGYDPLKNEYLITVLDPVTWGPKGASEFPDQPDADPESIILGCMDPLAINYNPNATHSNPASCEYPISGCMDPLALNYNPNATVDNGECKYPYTVEPYSGDPCDYDGLKGDGVEGGDINEDSVRLGFQTVVKNLRRDPGDPNYMSPYDASLYYPDFDGDGLWKNPDLEAGLALAPQYCSGGEGPLFPTTAGASFTWRQGEGEPIDFTQGISTSYFYAGVAGYEDLINGELIANSPEISEDIHINLHNLQDLNEGEEIKITITLPLDDSINWLLPPEEGGPSIPYSQAVVNYDEANNEGVVNSFGLYAPRSLWQMGQVGAVTMTYNFMGSTQFDIPANLDSIGSVETVNNESGFPHKHIFTISGDKVSSFLQTQGPLEFENGLVVISMQAPTSRLGTWLSGVRPDIYEQPMLLLGADEDVERINSVKVDVSYTGVSNEDYSLNGQTKLTLGWGVPDVLPSPGQKAIQPNVVQFVDIDQPFPFTGNICDYPVFTNDAGFPGSTGGMLMSYAQGNRVMMYAYHLRSRIDDPSDSMTETEATHHFPNWAHTSFADVEGPGWGPTYPNGGTSSIATNWYFGNQDVGPATLGGNPPTGTIKTSVSGWVGYEDYFNYFVENDGVGDALNFAAYGGLGGDFLQFDNNCPSFPWGTGVGTYGLCECSGMNCDEALWFAKPKYCDLMSLGGLDAWITAAWIRFLIWKGGQEGYTYYTEYYDLFCVAPPTLQYQNNPCDYPRLLDKAGFITEASINQAFVSTTEDILNGLSNEEATFVFPDMNGDGIITVSDVIALIQSLTNQFPFPCDGVLPYTGNLCDYPLLWVSDNPTSEMYGLINFQSFTSAYEFTIEQINTGEWANTYATNFFPDLSYDGWIGAADLLVGLKMVPFDCSELGGDPGGGQPTKGGVLGGLAIKKKNKKEKKK